MIEDRSRLLGPADVSSMLGVPVATLANWRCAGKGPPYLRVGRHVRYRREDLELWLDRQVRRTEGVSG
jgi:hypothetical protein